MEIILIPSTYMSRVDSAPGNCNAIVIPSVMSSYMSDEILRAVYAGGCAGTFAGWSWVGCFCVSILGWVGIVSLDGLAASIRKILMANTAVGILSSRSMQYRFRTDSVIIDGYVLLLCLPTGCENLPGRSHLYLTYPARLAC